MYPIMHFAANFKMTSQVSNERLVEVIQIYETIYNEAYEYYKYQRRKKNAWAPSAEELNIREVQIWLPPPLP